MNDKLKIKIPIANRVYPMIIEPSKEQGLRLASQKINNLFLGMFCTPHLLKLYLDPPEILEI